MHFQSTREKFSSLKFLVRINGQADEFMELFESVA